VVFKFINLWQTKEERQEKYHLARSLGMNSYWAAVMRDWRLAKIERLFGLTGAPVDHRQPVLSVNGHSLSVKASGEGAVTSG